MAFAPENQPGSPATYTPSHPFPNRTVHVLAVSSAEEDLRLLRHLFTHSNWVIHTARGCAEAADFLRYHPIPVILCDCELADGSWPAIPLAARVRHHGHP